MAYIEKRTRRDGTASYRVQIRLKGHPAEARTFRRKSEAVAWARRVETEIDRRDRFAATPDQRRFTLGELFDHYEEQGLPSLSVSDQRNRVRMLGWWRQKVGQVPLLQLRPLDAAKALRDLEAQGGLSGRPISVSTRNRYVTAVSAVLTWAAKERVYGIDVNPLRGAFLRRTEPRGRVRFLSEDERERLLDACRESESSNLYLIVLMAISTGMRRGELLALRWKDLHLDQARAIIEHSKNGDRRAVPLAGPVLEVLTERATVRYLATDLVFASPEGRVEFPRKAWDTALRRAEIEDFRFHDCRHTAASYLAMSGATLAEIAEVLGHRTLAMVKRYAHLTESHTLEVARRMADRFLS